MMTESHEPWIHQLSAYLDGDLTDEGRQAIEEHLVACGPCRLVLEELREVVRLAHGLEDQEPPRDLWPGIAVAIAEPAAGPPRPHEADVIELPTARRVDAAPAGLYLTVRQLVAASIVLAVVSAAATWWVGPGASPMGGGMATPEGPAAVRYVADDAGPPADLVEELGELERLLTESRGRLDPNTLRILEKNLGVIQRAIDESVQALVVDPDNTFLKDHLDGAYRQKATYLREAADIAAWSGDE